jgi:hypothetical protein
VTVENIQGSHHPDNRLHLGCWYPVSLQRRAEGCAQNFLRCFGYDAYTFERFLGRNLLQLCPRMNRLIMTIPAYEEGVRW